MDKNTGKILICSLQDMLFSILLQDNQILSINAQKQSPYMVGSIYIGKVSSISRSIDAAFVDLGKNFTTFLSLSEEKDVLVTNRSYNGKLQVGDEVLVQIVREPMKTKLAGVTSRISLSGTYAVVGRSHGHGAGIQVSAKLSKKKQQYFKNLESLQKLSGSCQLTVRTNAGRLTSEQPLVAEAIKLSETLQHILTIADKRTCFSCLYQAAPDYISFIQNAYREEYSEILTDLPDVYELIKQNITDDSVSIRFYEDSMLPLYKLYSLEVRIKELLSKKVWLKSGGYLVIEPTEALISIDVNTGKYEKGKNKEQTNQKINLEAAQEIARQLRARNLSGMILVDFINCQDKEFEKELISYMRSLLRHDPVTAAVVDMTGLGLMEITRKKILPSLAEQINLHKNIDKPI